MWIAGGISLALVGTIAVVASGYDARETPRAEAGVWVARDAGQYARVNTDTGEIDTVRTVEEPSGIVQTGGEGVLLSHGNGRAWPIDAANPLDLGAGGAEAGGAEADDTESDGADTGDAELVSTETAGSEPTGTDERAVRMPDGTREVLGTGGHILVRTESGEAHLGNSARLGAFEPLAPPTGDEVAPGERYSADAIALAEDGTGVLFSAQGGPGQQGAVHRFSAATAEVEAQPSPLPEGAEPGEGSQLALVGGDWVLLDAEAGTLWREDAGEISLDLVGEAKLQASTVSSTPSDTPGGDIDDVLIADGGGLWHVSADGQTERVAEAEGAPAQPVQVEGIRFAAWLGPSSGTLWREDEGPTPLQFDDSAGDTGEPRPVFRSNGERAVLAESRTGMLWTLPDGESIPLAQWTISDPPKEERGTLVVEEVTEQEPPVAVDDAFGVRAGEPAPLPVLLNDYDPNRRDVLTIVPESLEEGSLPASFGTVDLLPDAQSLTVHPEPGVTGTATLQYRVTDGTLVSDPATVTLTVVDEDVNTAPAWCPVEGCQREWSVPAVAPGGTLVYPILDAWVDPEGDPMMLSRVDVVRSDDPAYALVTADGQLAVRHTDPGADASEVSLRVTVSDAHGEERQRELALPVRPDAAPVFLESAASVQVGEPATLRPLERVAGGSGSFALVDATVQGTSDLRVSPQQTSGTFEAAAQSAGTATVSVTVRDTVTGSEVTGALRVSATTGSPPLALPPLRAFVRPLSDTTVEVLDAVPGADSRALVVQSADVVDGELRAEVIEHARVRVAGSTADGAPGRVGAAALTITEGDVQREGRLTVFQVPETGGGTIAVPDSATVRAGSVVDIRVLDNDVAAPGERLVLHPEISGSEEDGELAFASGSVLRYLAPKKPGTYELEYTAYGASAPESSDVGTVNVTVVPEGSNRDPQPRTVTVRAAPGDQAEARIPLSGVDPDGDRVRLTGVGAPEDPRITATLAASGSAVSVAVSSSASRGVSTVDYTVRDDFGGTATGTVRIIVTEPAADVGAPIASTDQVRLVQGSTEPATVRPLDNDIDPAGGSLSLVAVEPNVPAGTAEYRRLAARLDTGDISKGRIAVTAGEELGTAAYRYTVRSSTSSSTADGLILVQTSERVGAQAPVIADTVLNVRDRAVLQSTGVDVVTDRVHWATGDVSALQLSLWGASRNDYEVRGNRILGDYKPEGDLVVFRLSGADSAGNEVSSYGFLIVPPLDELRLTLQSGAGPITVDEGAREDVSLRSLVDVGAGDRVELRRGSFATQRSQASCSAASADTLRYSAGDGGPWSDVCLIDARLIGQRTWTTLSVPVNVVPREPIAELAALTRTVAPGGSETIDLGDMVRWQGGRSGSVSQLEFTLSGAGPHFSLRQQGTSVTVEADAAAPPGRQQTVTVEARGAETARSTLTLRVGEAPRDTPRGGTVSLSCEIGSECRTDLVGVAGEHDPFVGRPGGGLTVDTIDGDSCAFGTFSRVGGTGVSVSWPGANAPGGTCTVGFTVRDAQDRAGSGTIEFEARGAPRAPSIRQTDYTSTTATFSVQLGTPAAHPAVTGVRLSGAGSSNCSASGPTSYQCVVSGLVAGEQHRFTARSVNAVGESSPSSAVTGWAFAAPSVRDLTAENRPDSNTTATDRGTARVRVSGSSDTRRFELFAGDRKLGELNGSGPVSRDFTLPPGNHTIRAVPIGRFSPPPGTEGSNRGRGAETRVRVSAAPLPGDVRLVAAGETGARAEVSGWKRNYDRGDIQYTYALSGPDGSAPETCEGGQESRTFEDLAPGSYRVTVCGATDSGRTTKSSTDPLVIAEPEPDPDPEATN